MKIKSLLILSFLTYSALVSADQIIAKMAESQSGFKVNTLQNNQYTLKMPYQFQKYMPSLTSDFFTNLVNNKGQSYPDYYLKFNGEVQDQMFEINQMPITMSAPIEHAGILTKTNNGYMIDTKLVQFESAQNVNGSAFNDRSITFFLNKEVKVLLKKESSDRYTITAIAPRYLFSANDTVNTAPVNMLMRGITRAKRSEKIDTYLLRNLYANSASQSGDSFRQNIFSNKQVKPGDKALVITLSGRQGDDPGAIAGHYASGMATVKDDLSLEMEIWNYYDVPNEKLIMSASNHFLDYYGHLTAGQANYRPTYTMVLYGIQESMMKKISAELNEDFYQMREALKEFGAHYNCTTETTKAFRHNGLKGVLYNKPLSHLFKKIGAVVISPFELFSSPFTSTVKELRFSVQHDPNKYVPRAAFESMLKNLSKLEKKFSITRADYIFQTQTPSNRYLGGAPVIGAYSVYSGKDYANEIAENPNDWNPSKIFKTIENLKFKDGH